MIILVKAPRPGTVKTRLRLGAAAECAAYQRLAQTVLHQMAPFHAVELRFSPSDAEPEIRMWLQDGWTAAPQGGGHIGQRMQSAFTDAFATGTKRVVIIGSDCPYLNGDDIHAAWNALKSADLVLGPAEDGGYWLIGLRQNQPALFANMPWSSNEVFSETIARAKALGLKTFLLRTLSDVDTREDWEKFISAEAQGRKPPPGPHAD
ncbi:MAG TPA: TIGR04282 family arsenosugar biosynthesis glycosyltransferase [Candidatus Binatia bacterium]|nr:TIGR04282 family arsenosugar biosynthesis glycosyltransferase [Candidatus Binatia bacterium]